MKGDDIYDEVHILSPNSQSSFPLATESQRCIKFKHTGALTSGMVQGWKLGQSFQPTIMGLDNAIWLRAHELGLYVGRDAVGAYRKIFIDAESPWVQDMQVSLPAIHMLQRVQE